MWIARFIRRARERAGPERGFFMVWMALTLVTLTAFAGLGLEYSRWNTLATRIQKAADAAALAGAIFMPENLAQATTTARSITSQNGFTNLANGITVTTAAGKLPNQLKVAISVPTHNPWGQLVNYNSTTITRSAVAEYQLPQNLGSPANTYGNDPESALVQPQFWGNIFGPSSTKEKGDAIQSVGPNANTTLCTADNCNGTVAAPVAGVNRDYDANGYFYGIEVPAAAVGALNVQVFDPAFVHVGDNCGGSDADALASLNQASTLLATEIPGYPPAPAPAPSVRYASAATSAYCSGDNWYGDNGNNLNPWTTWTLREPDVSSWDPTNNPIVCQAEFPGSFPERDNDVPNGTVNAGRLKAMLKDTATVTGTNPARTFASYFRQWVQLCSIASPIQGTYFLQVQTAKKISGVTTPNGGGSNRYSIRTGLGTNFTSSNNLKLYGNQKMGIYANASGADTRFYLTRVLPGEAGHTLILNFFDTGDASAAGAISVLPPPDSNVTGGLFSDCLFTKPPGNSSGPPWGTFIDTSPGCQVTGVSNTTTAPGPSYNGQWVTYQVPIPDDYTCAATDPLGCWTRLRFTYPAGTNVSDTTTWSAFMLGDPVRLIQ